MTKKTDSWPRPQLTVQAKAALANRERAYIAASRRRDRSDEARLESALRGSEIHKELTGKSLLVTRDIVMTGGEYIEEDPAFERLLARRQQGQGSPNSPTKPNVDRWASQRNQVQFINGYQIPTIHEKQTDLITSKEISNPETIHVQIQKNSMDQNRDSNQSQRSTQIENKLNHSIEQEQQDTIGTPFTTNESGNLVTTSDPLIHHQWITSNEDFTFSNYNDMDSFRNHDQYQDTENHQDMNNSTFASYEFSIWCNEEEYSLLDHDSIRF